MMKEIFKRDDHQRLKQRLWKTVLDRTTRQLETSNSR